MNISCHYQPLIITDLKDQDVPGKACRAGMLAVAREGTDISMENGYDLFATDISQKTSLSLAHRHIFGLVCV